MMVYITLESMQATSYYTVMPNMMLYIMYPSYVMM